MMTREYVIRMAREAGCINDEWMDAIMPFLRSFAAIVAQHEREACARVCDEHHARWDMPGLFESAIAAEDCAAAIRARGEVRG